MNLSYLLRFINIFIHLEILIQKNFYYRISVLFNKNVVQIYKKNQKSYHTFY